MTADPADDQRAARMRDMRELSNLIEPHLTGRGINILPLMPPDQATQARELLDRIGPLEDPAITAARRAELLKIAQMETRLQDMAAHPQPKVRNGKIVTDPQTGEPVPDPAIQRQVRALSAMIKRRRERLTGLPAPDDPGDSAH